jgi:hypothetical protein
MKEMTDAVKLARYDDLAEAIEEIHNENMVLLQAIRQTLDDNGHLADGENCTLIALKLALRKIGVPWKGDELPNVQSDRRSATTDANKGDES